MQEHIEISDSKEQIELHLNSLGSLNKRRTSAPRKPHDPPESAAGDAGEIVKISRETALSTADHDALLKIAEDRRNVIVCSGSISGKSVITSILTGMICRATNGQLIHAVLERYDRRFLLESGNLVPDPGMMKLRAALRKGALPECVGLVIDEVYTSSASHALLTAWNQGKIGVGTMTTQAPEKGECVGKLRVLEEFYTEPFSDAEIISIYKKAKPVIIKVIRPTVIKILGHVETIPDWVER